MFSGLRLHLEEKVGLILDLWTNKGKLISLMELDNIIITDFRANITNPFWVKEQEKKKEQKEKELSPFNPFIVYGQ